MLRMFLFWRFSELIVVIMLILTRQYLIAVVESGNTTTVNIFTLALSEISLTGDQRVVVRRHLAVHD
jgi:hypothetical protein